MALDVVNAMRDDGVLISTTGANEDSLKVRLRSFAKPSMLISSLHPWSARSSGLNWDSVGLEQLVSLKRSKTRTSCEVLDDFSTFYRAHDAMKG
jgi:hypothetical protein